MARAARRLTRVARHLSTLPSPPISALVAPGRCAFGGDDWIAAPLLERAVLSHDTIRVSFGLPDRTRPLNLATCACILARGGKGGDGEPVVRPYTPTSTNSMLGAFELVVKVYPDGTLSRAMSEMAIGEALQFKHVPQNVKVQYPFSASHVAMLVGGTGITPMVQALHAILGTPGDTTVITMLLGNKTEEDILLRTQLDHWSAAFPDRLRITHVLSDAPPPAAAESSWSGERGFITSELIRTHVPPPAENPLVMVCGPPPMYDALCGARDESALTGTLAALGYDASQVVKF